MSDELNTVLRLVAEGKLSPDEAAPIIDALTASRREPRAPDHGTHDHGAHDSAHGFEHSAGGIGAEGRGRRVRIQVSERGRRVVDVRVPLAFAAMAARAVPGIPDGFASLIERAVTAETMGTIVDTEDEGGDRVLITLE